MHESTLAIICMANMSFAMETILGDAKRQKETKMWAAIYQIDPDVKNIFRYGEH
jgi:hypothetical protein